MKTFADFEKESSERELEEYISNYCSRVYELAVLDDCENLFEDFEKENSFSGCPWGMAWMYVPESPFVSARELADKDFLELCRVLKEENENE